VSPSSDPPGWRRPGLRPAFAVGVLVAGGVAVVLAALAAAVVVGPLVFWIAWNVLDFGNAIGLEALGFWAIALATLFLVVGWPGKVLITGIVFLADPAWLHRSAEMRWPEATFRNFVAVALLAVLASRPHAHAHKTKTRHRRRNAGATATTSPG